MSKSKTTQQQEESKLFDGAIGIDFGSSYSSIAVYQNNKGNLATPSCVSFSDEDIIFGEAARQLQYRNPKNTIYHIKRFIGKKYKTVDELNAVAKQYPFKILQCESSTDGQIRPCFQVQHKNQDMIYTPEQLCTLVLKYLKTQAEAYLGKTVTRCVLAVPTHFDNDQRDALKGAAKEAGLEVIGLIHDPVAAVMQFELDRFKSDEKPLKKVLVLDLGGTSLDITLLYVRNGLIELKAKGGDPKLGGCDFDEKIVKFCLDSIKRTFNVDLVEQNNQRAINRLRDEAERVKMALSNTQRANIDADALFDGMDFKTSITRARFEMLVTSLFSQCLNAVSNLLTSNGLEKQDIDDIILVGGTTMIPKLQARVKQFFEKDISIFSRPDETIVSGAAIQAWLLTQRMDKKDIKEIKSIKTVPNTIGLAAPDGTFVPLITKDSVLPVTKTQIFTTSVDNQQSVFIHLFEGESKIAKENKSLGRFVVSGLAPDKKAGEPKIEVKFTLDENGVLSISAKDKATGKESNYKITNTQQETKKE